MGTSQRRTIEEIKASIEEKVKPYAEGDILPDGLFDKDELWVIRMESPDMDKNIAEALFFKESAKSNVNDLNVLDKDVNVIRGLQDV